MFTYKVNEHTELKLLELRHTEELFAVTKASSKSLREWLPWVDFIDTSEDSKKFILGTMKQFSDNNGFQAGIWYKGELAGVIGLHKINWMNQSTSIGYWLGEKFTGKGIMTSCCSAVVDYCFQELALHRVEIRAATENYRSSAVPARLGFQKEGCLRDAEWINGKFVDHYVFSLLNEKK